MDPVYKIFRAEEWALFEAAGETAGAPIDHADGFIHLSSATQVAETAARHFAGEDGLMLLAIAAEDLTWEPSRGGALFPHLYRMLRAADVLWAKPLPRRDGGHVFDGLV
ncbi:MAG: DUF952 domain-containing protein [Pseudomonadota bacterium]